MQLWRLQSPKSIGWGQQAEEPGKSHCYSSSMKAVCWQDTFLLKGGQSLFY